MVFFVAHLFKNNNKTGMMDGAYFVGRKELLDFFNDLLDLNLTKIEQTCSGAVACQLTELIFPESIIMSRVNWEAKSDYEYVQNYKLLQVAFTKHHVQRHVDVDKLIRGKYQDNLEFCQWLKAFYDQAGSGAGGGGRGRNNEEYNPRAVRARGKGGKRFNDSIPMKKGGSSSSSSSSLMTRGGGGTTKRAPPPPPQRTAIATKTTTAVKAAISTKPTIDTDRESRPLRERPAGAAGTNRAVVPSTTTDSGMDAAAAAIVADAQLLKKNAELSNRVEELETNMAEMERERDQAVVDIEKERDFYFDKLRSVEVLLQVHQERLGPAEATTADDQQQQHQQLVDKIFQILYATAEDNLVVNDEGDVVDAATIVLDGAQDLADML
jgi:microtubule-associated protein, RP/EB family